MSTPVLYDVVLVAIFVGSILLCANRGALKAVSGIAGTVIGCLGARYLADSFTPLVSGFLRPMVERMVENAAGAANLSQLLEGTVEAESLQQFGQLLELLHVPADFVETAAQQAQAAGAQFLRAACDAVLAQIAPVIAFVLLFVVLKLAVSLLCSLLSFDIPVIRSLNRTAGALLGALSGLIIVLVLCWGILQFAPQQPIGPINQPEFTQSVIGGAFASLME